MKDNIAFVVVILTFLFGGFAALALSPREPVDRKVLSLLNVEWFKPVAPAEVRYIEPITVIGYRDLPEQPPARVANVHSTPALGTNVINAGITTH